MINENKKYDIIYADPPWDYGGNGKIGMARDYFPCMSLKKLKEMPIKDLTAENCLLFLWVVNPELKSGIELGEFWGFKYITVGFVWEKPNKILCGNYTMSSVEQCLIFRKGKIPKPRGTRNEKQFLSLSSGNLRCRKPDEIRNRITRMFPTQNKLELFSTQKIEDDNWNVFGNEVENSIEIK